MSDNFEQWFEMALKNARESGDKDLHYALSRYVVYYKYGFEAALSSLQGDQEAKIAEQDAEIARLTKELEEARKAFEKFASEKSRKNLMAEIGLFFLRTARRNNPAEEFYWLPISARDEYSIYREPAPLELIPLIKRMIQIQKQSRGKHNAAIRQIGGA